MTAKRLSELAIPLGLLAALTVASLALREPTTEPAPMSIPPASSTASTFDDVARNVDGSTMVAYVDGVRVKLPPCPTEDSDNCFWNAETRGNGLGESFVSIVTAD